METVKQKSAQL